MDALTDIALALDPALFAEYVTGYRLDPWQAEAMRSTADRMLFNCARQSGKSLIAALIALHTATYQPGSLSLLLSPTLRQSQELFRKVKDAFQAVAPGAPSEAESALRLELANGSRVVSLPGQERTVRGYSGVKLLVIDEAARVANDLYVSTRPMLAVSGGRLLALSTPFGARGWWFDAWRGGGDWERYEIDAWRCPRISPEFLAQERRDLGVWWYAQEYMCQFMDAESMAFRQADIEAAFGEVTTWDL